MVDPASTRWTRVEEIFRRALELKDDERAAFVEQNCHAQPEIRQEVDGLLAAHERAGGFLETPAGESVPPTDPPPGLLGRTIENYTIRKLIATGGMGAVYEAEQLNPRRTVALKIMRQELVTASSRRRFEYEGHLLGRLRHPRIAQIFEAGIAETEHGPLPYFAMELVCGQTLTRFSKSRRLSIRAKLELLIHVCEAVHHAHLHGVIHRDLKPDNILVDETGEPKVLDFGIARSTDVDAQVTTMRTSTGQIMGTLAYMSPEQVSGDTAAVDFRSDVYALGVVGYELLTASLPHEVIGKTTPEAIRILHDEEARRLSTVDRIFRGDLDTIIAKALERDKHRRYASASEFGADLRRFLRNEPITAKPGGTLYQFRKFVRRHRVGVGFAATVVALLIIGVITTTTQAVRATLAERRARQEADTATAVTTFMTETLTSADPFRDSGSEVTVREALDVASNKLENELRDQPAVRAAVHESIGETYRHLGIYDKADSHLREAVAIHARLYGDDSPRTATSRLCLAALRKDQSDYHEARRLLERVVDQRRRHLGPNHEDTLNAMISLADVCHESGDVPTAISLARQATESFRQRFGENNGYTLSAENNLAIYLQTYGRLREARPLLEKALAGRRMLFGDTHPKTLITMDNLATLLNDLGEEEEAERVSHEAVAGFERTLGEEHFETLRALSNLGLILQKRGKLDEAEDVYRRTLSLRRRVLGEDHLDTLGSYNNLANLLADRGKVAEAESFMRRAREGVRGMLGTENRYYVFTTSSLATILDDQGKHAEAGVLHREAMAAAESILPTGHPRLFKIRTSYGRCLTSLHEFTDAEELLIATYREAKHNLGGDNELTKDARQAVADLYDAWGKDSDAAAWLAPEPSPVPPKTGHE